MMSNLTLESYDIAHKESEGRINQSRDTPSNLTARINGHKFNSSPRDLEALSLESMEVCSRFEFCSAAKCPLDLLISARFEDPDDPKCEMAKASRHKYWESMVPELRSLLPFQGYLETEFNRMKAARERWDSLPEEKKAAIRERMKNVSRSEKS